MNQGNKYGPFSTRGQLVPYGQQSDLTQRFTSIQEQFANVPAEEEEYKVEHKKRIYVLTPEGVKPYTVRETHSYTFGKE